VAAFPVFDPAAARAKDGTDAEAVQVGHACIVTLAGGTRGGGVENGKGRHPRPEGSFVQKAGICA
jgi:hypothetical protein